MMMRVWVLASCGGLLALSACSAEPTTTAQPSPLDPSDDDLQAADRPSVLDHTPGTTITERDLIRPELRPSRSQRAPIPSAARSQRTTLSPEQLRDRVERIRAQQIQRSPTPGRAPGMAQTRPPAQASQADGADVALRPGMVPTATLTITPLTPPPRPTLSPVAPSPSVASDSIKPSAATSVAPTNLDHEVAVFLGEASTQAADLGVPEPATLARNFPLRSTAHQSDGARHRQDSVVISVAQPSDLTDVAQREIPGRGAGWETSTAHHSPWMTADQVASQVDSQPLFAQAEAQPRATTDATHSVLEPESTALPQSEIPATEVTESLETEGAEFQSTEGAESLETEGAEFSQAERVIPSPVVLPSSELSADPSLSAPGPGLSAPVDGAESPHWSALGPEVSVSAVPMALDGPRFADSNAHQRSESAAPTTASVMAESAAEWSSSGSISHCARPPLTKPLPSDTLADSAILEAKGIPGEMAAEEIAAEEIAVVDCP
ncbi:MAG: hypothetical protein ACHWZW_00450 [Spirulina sp.]